MFVNYRWTEDEKRAYDKGVLPQSLSQCRGNLVGVPLLLFTQTNATRHAGPMVSGPQFRRLNACSLPRIILWGLWGEEAQQDYSFANSLAIIPSTDFRPTRSQRHAFKAFNTKQNSDNSSNYAPNLPYLGECLCTGLSPSEYTVTRRGPLLFDGIPIWEDLWTLLSQLMRPGPDLLYPQHPKGIWRCRDDFRTTISTVHQSTADEDAYQSSDTGRIVNSARAATRQGPRDQRRGGESDRA